MASGDLKRAKRDIRRAVLARRDALAAEQRDRRGRRVVDRFIELPQVRAASHVMAFWSFGSEVPTLPLIERLHDLGIGVVLPRIVGGDLHPRSYVPGDPLLETSFGALEPTDDAPAIRPDDIDLVAVPAVAFDRRGARVGYGGGFYDRFLPTVRDDALTVGIAYDLQVVGGQLPAGGLDVAVDLVVTESRTIVATPSRAGVRPPT